MTNAEFRAALTELGLAVASQRTGKLLGLSVRQTQRLVSGHATVPESVAILLDMYRKHGTDERWRTIRCSKHGVKAIMVDEFGIWDANFPWGVERLHGLHTTKRSLEDAVRARYKKRQETEKKRKAA